MIAGVCADLGPEAVVQAAAIAPVAVTAGFVDDLRLVLAELVANAVEFSPPGSPVQVAAELRGQVVVIAIVDHGLGLTQARVDEENGRLVERERLDVVPTSVLGLFVVGRLARRHELSVRLQHTQGGGITALVAVPIVAARPAVTGRRGPPARSRRRPPSWPPASVTSAGSPVRSAPPSCRRSRRGRRWPPP